MTISLIFSPKEYFIWSISALIIGFVIGAIFWNYWPEIKYQFEKGNESITFQGWRIASTNKTDALRFASASEPRGDWICVNIDQMSYDRAVEVCKHEAAHELFAESCETNSELCNKTQELLSEYTKNNGGA
jgi:hypothetical protein